MKPPTNPKIYHITHYDNLKSIIKDKAIFSDSYCHVNNKHYKNIGKSDIKKRRFDIKVPCHPNTKVAQHVPFYFCPGSVMLYKIHKTCSEGQNPIVHIQADMKSVVKWAKKNKVSWAFSPLNAARNHNDFYNEMKDLTKIDWDAVERDYFNWPSYIKYSKQAEFLLYLKFPCNLIESIGVIDANMQTIVKKILRGSGFVNKVQIKKDWYF